MNDNRRPGNVIDIISLRERTRVFEDRAMAGELLAEMLAEGLGMDDRASPGVAAGLPLIVLGIPAGGVAVAAEIAEQFETPLDVAVTNKVTPPFNTEFGYGAVAFDGTVRVDQSVARSLGLSDEEIRQGIEAARVKVRRRVKLFRGERPFPELAGQAVILVDDGLATGATMLVAIEAVKKHAPAALIVAVPTAHAEAVSRLEPLVDALYCPNIRSGPSYCVADAYRNWRDMSEAETAELLRPAIRR